MNAKVQCELELCHAFDRANKRWSKKKNYGFCGAEAVYKFLVDGVVLIENGTAASAKLLKKLKKLLLEKVCSVTFRTMTNAKL